MCIEVLEDIYFIKYIICYVILYFQITMFGPMLMLNHANNGTESAILSIN